MAGDLVRVGDDERERVVATLHEHASRGRLDPEELDERVERALGARTRADLESLTRDLPEEAPRRASRPSTAVERFRRHVGIFTVMMLFFVAIWALGGGGPFWPAWAALGWGIALGIQGVRLLTPGADDEDRDGEPDRPA